jgi:hypothetical protein
LAGAFLAGLAGAFLAGLAGALGAGFLFAGMSLGGAGLRLGGAVGFRRLRKRAGIVACFPGMANRNQAPVKKRVEEILGGEPLVWVVLRLGEVQHLLKLDAVMLC